MRLLKKQEIQEKKASERKMEIDEGIKLARRVDGLRELAAQEEANVNTVRAQSSRQLKAEITPLIAQKEALMADIKELRHQRQLDLIPLDAEWEKVQQEKESINGLKEGLFETQTTLAERTQQVERQEREAEIEKGRIADFKHTAAENLVQSEHTLEQAREDAADMRNKVQATLSLVEVREHEILKREARIAVREREIKMHEERNERFELNLIGREKLLRDNEQTLQRNISRLNLKK